MTDDEVPALRERYLAHERPWLLLSAGGLGVLFVVVVVLLRGRGPFVGYVLMWVLPFWAWTLARRFGTYRSVRDLDEWVTGRLLVEVAGSWPRSLRASGRLIIGDEELAVDDVNRADGWTPWQPFRVDVAVSKRWSLVPYAVALTEAGGAYRLRHDI